VTAPRRFDVVGLSHYMQRVRRAVFLADDRHDRDAVAALQQKQSTAEDLERATVPANERDARRKLVTAANEARNDDLLAVDDELLQLSKRPITAADLKWLRAMVRRWERSIRITPRSALLRRCGWRSSGSVDRH
jgi:hypothetical protein